MQPYLNLGGDSGVRFFEIMADRIRVQFSTGAMYTYSYASCGQHHVEQMKTLAQNGHGLNSYIMRFVRTGYER
ncbi:MULTISPECIES: hypothetical protein [Halomonas]|uniref:KTSC domain-containing protein n=1 Tax=Halomonas halophila TaxID=29573 RepID=A0ABQ0U767_9GAMM|nr:MULTISPECIES: hypothetical protein [Halomonas]MDR5891105.1 hypothetical protein [Halomonas salina]WJY08449.1 hypothetical protein QWG60_05915 [Halomonas halophila]GEK74252.1 hypothetical protein HHA04nite_27960 [Halomonas halophila]